MKVLIVDDSKTMRNIQRGILEKIGYEEIDEVENGVEATSAVEKELPGLILLDWNMPEMDGLEASTRIRDLGGEKGDVPIVALTANAMASDRQKCMRAGMNDFLSKPFDPADFHAMLAKWCVDQSALEAAS